MPLTMPISVLLSGAHARPSTCPWLPTPHECQATMSGGAHVDRVEPRLTKHFLKTFRVVGPCPETQNAEEMTHAMRRRRSEVDGHEPAGSRPKDAVDRLEQL